MLVEIFVSEVAAVLPEHAVQLLAGGRIGREITGVALPELRQQIERDGELAIGG